MKFLNKRELRLKTTLSIQHITRLEAEAKFPKRVRLTDAKNGRVGWLESDVDDWMRVRMEKRNSK